MYKAICDFYDLQDDRRAGRRPPLYQHYKPGDTYPRDGFQPTESRLAELSSDRNALGHPLIKEIEEEREEKKTRRRSRKKGGETDGTT